MRSERSVNHCRGFHKSCRFLFRLSVPLGSYGASVESLPDQPHVDRLGFPTPDMENRLLVEVSAAEKPVWKNSVGTSR